MRPIDADRLLTDRMKSKYYHLPNGDIAIPLVDIEHAPTIDPVRKGKWIDGQCSNCGCDVPFEIAVKAISKMAENIPQQPEPKNKLISEIEGKTPEETYDFLVWLLNDYGMQFTDSRQAVIEWLRGEQDAV